MGYWKKNDRWRKEGSGPRQVIMQSPAIVATNSTPAAAESGLYDKNPPKISIEKFVKLTHYQFKALYIMAGYGNYANLSKKVLRSHRMDLFSAGFSYLEPLCGTAATPAAAGRNGTRPEISSRRFNYWAGLEFANPFSKQRCSDSSCCSSVAATAPSAATPRQAAAACVPSHDSLEKLVEKQIFFSFFPWICSNSFNISLSTTRNLWIVYGGFTRPPGGGGLTWL